VRKHVVIPAIRLPVTRSSDEMTFFRNHESKSAVSSETSNYLCYSPLNLVDEDQSSVIVFKEDILDQI